MSFEKGINKIKQKLRWLLFFMRCMLLLLVGETAFVGRSHVGEKADKHFSLDGMLPSPGKDVASFFEKMDCELFFFERKV